jgi:hypothetical protein
MRALGPVVILVLALVITGYPALPPPKLDGHFRSVSNKDLQEITELIRADMKKDFSHVVPIDRIEVIDHNNVMVYYHTEGHNYIAPAKRVRDTWSIPTVTVTG